MNAKAFLADALGQALDLGIGTPDDVLKHVTPEILASYLPRPLWARLFTACLGASRVDAQLVVETIGIPNMCEHVPASLIWQCIAEIAARSLGQAYTAPPQILTRSRISEPSISPPPSAASSMLAPPPDEMVAPAAVGTQPGGPSIPSPLNDLISELEQDDRPVAAPDRLRARTPTSQRFRTSNTGIGRLGQTQQTAQQQRRPQAPVAPVPGRPRRTGTEVEDVETQVGDEVRAREIAVDDSQLVDWQSSETTAATDEDFSDIARKRRE
ncbi:hypothetical protein BH11MYX1_BH11MYX1_32220 [soil metagenome]